MEIVQVNINELRAAEYNPRKWSKKAISDLTESISKYGLVEPVLCNSYGERKNVIIGGHFRIRIAKELGYTEMPVVYVNIPNLEKERELCVRLNKNTGEFDLDILKGFNADMLFDVGFTTNELSSIMDSLKGVLPEESQKDKEIENVPKTKPGQLYQLGSHRLLCADSTKEENIKKLMGGELANLLYSDMPYNINLDYDKGFGSKSKYGGHTNDSKSEGEYSQFVKTTISNGVKFCKKDSHIFWYTDENYVWLVQTTYKEIGIIPKRLCIWAKNSANPTPEVAFNKSFEVCVYGTIGNPRLNGLNNLTGVLNKEVTSGNDSSLQLQSMTGLWVEKRLPTSEYTHPTEKPPTLHEKPYRRCSKRGDIILDLFAGSGSSMAAAEQLGRKCYMIELEPIFCDRIIERYERMTGKKAVLLEEYCGSK